MTKKININLDELKRMDYQRPAREILIETQEKIKDKKCWCENEANSWFKVRKVEGDNKVFFAPVLTDEIWGRCGEHLTEFREKDGKTTIIMNSWWVRYYIIGEIKKMTDEEVEAEKEELKKDIIKSLNFHGFLGYQPILPSPINKLIQHGIFRRLARKMKVANWNLGNKLEIEEWLVKASKGKYTGKLLTDFWAKAQEYQELKDLVDDEK